VIPADHGEGSEEAEMSVLITMKVPGDVKKFRAALSERAEEMAGIGERAKKEGALHHRFGVGEDFVVVVDEWETVEQFQSFFGAPELQAFVAEVGGSGEPEIWVSEAVSSADQY
jgi:Antibiotic biosynthesis monooxygenase